MIFQGKDKEGLKTILIERGIKFFRKLKQKIVFILGEFFWREHSIEEAIDQIKFIDNRKLNTNEEITSFCEELVNNPFDINQFQYRIFICENDLNQTILFFQFDHSLSDGIGFISLISKLTDNFDIKKFPKLKDQSIFIRIVNFFSFPVMIFYLFYRFYLVRNTKSPFRINGELSGKKKMSQTKDWTFS